MKVLMLNGSPHETGCTYTALTEIATQLQTDGIDTEIFWTGNRAINPCLGCGACANLGQCVIDDRVNEFLTAAACADGFIFASPVH